MRQIICGSINCGHRRRVAGAAADRPTVSSANCRPFHIINVALNVVATKTHEWQERKAESFTIMPLHSGHARRIKNVGVRNYATANPDFPHQSTADQWFSESQLESYPALGFEIVDSLLNQVLAYPDCPGNPTLPEIFDILARAVRDCPPAQYFSSEKMAQTAAIPLALDVRENSQIRSPASHPASPASLTI
jgi:hypothetical protein